MTTATRPAVTRPTAARPTVTRKLDARKTTAHTSRPPRASASRASAARTPAPHTVETRPTKIELSPVEALVVETALGEEALRLGPDGVLARIQQLTRERQKLYAKTAAHPILAPTYAPRIRAVAAELEMLWELHRRQRATRRVQLERVFNVSSEVDPEEDERRARDFEDDNEHEMRAAPRRRSRSGWGAA